MPSKKVLEFELGCATDALKSARTALGKYETPYIDDGISALVSDLEFFAAENVKLTEVIKQQAAKKHVLEGKYDRLQHTIVELNKRNNRLRDHIVRSIENG